MADLYLADSSFRKIALIDDYESWIWTERYSGYGDFTLIMKRDSSFAQNLKSVNYLRMSESARVMMIETADSGYQTAKGEDAVKLTGRSFEAFLMLRNGAKYNDKGPDRVTGTRGGIANYIVNRYCINSTTAGPVNVIPNLSVAIAPATPTITLEVPKSDIYSTVKAILDAARLGWMIRIDADTGNPVFAVYQGITRTDPSDQFTYMEYSVDNENLIGVTTLESIANYKNHARVNGYKTGVDVYVGGASSSTSGLDRRTLVVDASDIGTGSTTVAEDQDDLTQRGYEILADVNNKYIKAVDGDIPQNAWQKVYYGLGDIVVVKDTYGNKGTAIISEQFWSSDATGQKQVPTFEPL